MNCSRLNGWHSCKIFDKQLILTTILASAWRNAQKSSEQPEAQLTTESDVSQIHQVLVLCPFVLHLICCNTPCQYTPLLNFTSSHFQFTSIDLCLFTSYGNIYFFNLFPLFHQHNLGVNKALVYGVANLDSLDHCQTGEINWAGICEYGKEPGI